MNIVKWRSKRNMMNIFDELEYMIGQAFGNSMGNDISKLPYDPVMNIDETDDCYLVMIDLPGVKKRDVEVNLRDGILTVAGERKRSECKDGNNQILHESTYGKFNQTFELASDISEDKINAKFKDGILRIAIPKSEEVKPYSRQIAVS